MGGFKQGQVIRVDSYSRKPGVEGREEQEWKQEDPSDISRGHCGGGSWG